MTLDNCIKMHKIWASDDRISPDIREEHKQMVEWLTDYKKMLDQENKVIQIRGATTEDRCGYDLARDVFDNIGKTDNHEISLEDTIKVISFWGFNEEEEHTSKIGFVCYCARQRIKKTFEHALVYGNYSMLKELIEYITEMGVDIQDVSNKYEPCEDYIRREFVEILVNYPPTDLCTYPEYKGKPYFSIKYRENGDEYVGFGTYKIEVLSQYIKEYFMPIRSKVDISIIDDIKAEIRRGASCFANENGDIAYGFMCAEEIIDKHIAENEE